MTDKITSITSKKLMHTLLGITRQNKMIRNQTKVPNCHLRPTTVSENTISTFMPLQPFTLQLLFVVCTYFRRQEIANFAR
jgi:hypothetical protein